MVSGILFFLFVIFIVIIVHECGHYFVAKRKGMKVDTFAIGFPPYIWSKKKNETFYRVGSIPLGGFLAIHGYENNKTQSNDTGAFRNFPLSTQALVVIAGPLFNYIFAFLIFFSLALFSPYIPAVTPSTTSHLQVVSISSESPLITVLEKGDRILLNDTTPRGTSLSYERKGSISTIPLSAPISSDEINVFPLQVGERAPHRAFAYATTYTIHITKEMAGALYKTITRAEIELLSGPIGIFSAGVSISETSWGTMLVFIALISMGVGFINLIPLPPLDGGRAALILFHAVYGSALSKRIENGITSIGIILLIILLVVVTFYDIEKIVSF